MINKSQLEGHLKSLIEERKYKSTNLTVFPKSFFKQRRNIVSGSKTRERTAGFTHLRSMKSVLIIRTNGIVNSAN